MDQLTNNNGFVKLPRTILEWEWYDHPDVFRIYIHILLKANYAAAKWRGMEILEGEHITSIDKLCTDLKLSEFKVRESLCKLKITGYIEIITTNKFTKLRVLKSALMDKYTGTNHEQIADQTSIKTQSKPNQTTTNNNNKEKKEIEERKKNLKNEIFKFSNEFPKEHLITFFDYWTLENKQTGRLKFEEEGFWNLELKLKSWKVFSTNKEERKLYKNRPV